MRAQRVIAELQSTVCTLTVQVEPWVSAAWPAPRSCHAQSEHVCFLFALQLKTAPLYILHIHSWSTFRFYKKVLEAYVYDLLGFLLCEDSSLGRVYASAFIKSTCSSLQDLNCFFFFFLLFFVPTGLHFQMLFIPLHVTCSCAYFWSRTSIDLLHGVAFYFSWVDPAASHMGVSFHSCGRS